MEFNFTAIFRLIFFSICSEPKLGIITCVVFNLFSNKGVVLVHFYIKLCSILMAKLIKIVVSSLDFYVSNVAIIWINR